jgi:hypothetical protein
VGVDRTRGLMQKFEIGGVGDLKFQNYKILNWTGIYQRSGSDYSNPKLLQELMDIVVRGLAFE